MITTNVKTFEFDGIMSLDQLFSKIQTLGYMGKVPKNYILIGRW